MRLCRFKYGGQTRWGIYDSQAILAVDRLAAAQLGEAIGHSWEAALPTDSAAWEELTAFLTTMISQPSSECESLPTQAAELLPPVSNPAKILLLAGNYIEHVLEQGGIAAEKQRTFPYVFMKPPSTTLVGSGVPFRLPVAPHKMDHEVELGVIIGQRTRDASLEECRRAILGYTVVNDLSDRGFRPNPARETRPRDTFFDWLHGKWHDRSCPCGPCLLLADAVEDPQKLELTLSIDGKMYQHGSTSQMIFGVVEVIQFLSTFITLEPGDIISTGTPAGVGHASGRYLKAGQTMVASIRPIGDLITPVINT
jgi:2,4-didehydro-3-deoxy-L-rhamnonate hydrolase